MGRIVLAYSGSFEATVAIPWLVETFGAELVTLTLDLGQGHDLVQIRDGALAAGAVRAHVLDVRQTFAEEYVLPALQAGAVREGVDPLATALTWPLIARKLTEIAGLEQAAAIAFLGARRDRDRTALEASIRALNPDIKLLEPARLWDMADADLIVYAEARGLKAPRAHSSYRVRANLWGRSVWPNAGQPGRHQPAGDLYARTRSPAEAPTIPAVVEVEFREGVPTAVNGVVMPIVDLITSLETIAGTHAVGRMNAGEDADSARGGVHEAPAAVVLHAAHRELQSFVIPADLQRLADQLSAAYVDLIETGRWQTPTREGIDAFVMKIQERVTGTIGLRLLKGECSVVDRQSDYKWLDGIDRAHLDDDPLDVPGSPEKRAPAEIEP